jgi:hypothetical protein
MKVTPFNRMLLRMFDVPIFFYKNNYDVVPNEALPISNNLDLKAFLRIKQDNPNEIMIHMLLQTLEKEKSQLDFTALSSAFFRSEIPFPQDQELNLGNLTKEQKGILLTALSVTYSTLRGFLLCKLPLGIDNAGTDDPRNIIPLIPLEELLKALEEGSEEILKEIQNFRGNSSQ